MQRGSIRNLRRFGIVLALVVAAALLPAAASAQGDGLERAIRAKDRATPWLLAKPGVVGAGVSADAAGQASIQVYTVSARVRGVPAAIDGIAVERIVTGLITARSCQTANDPTQRCDRPVPIGVSVGHPSVTAGTIGARVKSASGVFALSNNHVLANSNDASIGDATIQPGAHDGGTDPADRIGTLAAFKRIVFNSSACDGSVMDPDCNTMDAAISSTTTGNLGTATLPLANSYGTPEADPVSPTAGLAVTKCGRTTGCTRGSVQATSVTVDVCYKPQGPFFCAKNGIARFVDQISISDGTFSAGGDSGSLIVRSSDRRPVGLLFAGGSTLTFANKIGYVLSEFGVSIDTGQGSTTEPDTTSPAVPTNLVAVPGDGQVALDWDDNGEPDLAGYNVYRGTTSGGPYELVGTVAQSEHTITGLANGTTYHFVVTALDNASPPNESGRSNEATATPQATPVAAGPTDLTAVVRAQGSVKVDLAWTGGASTVDVWRAYDGGPSSRIATTSNSGSYRDNLGRNAASGTYTYQVCNAGTTSCSNSETVSLP